MFTYQMHGHVKTCEEQGRTQLQGKHSICMAFRRLSEPPIKMTEGRICSMHADLSKRVAASRRHAVRLTAVQPARLNERSETLSLYVCVSTNTKPAVRDATARRFVDLGLYVQRLLICGMVVSLGLHGFGAGGFGSQTYFGSRDKQGSRGWVWEGATGLRCWGSRVTVGCHFRVSGSLE